MVFYKTASGQILDVSPIQDVPDGVVAISDDEAYQILHPTPSLTMLKQEKIANIDATFNRATSAATAG